MSEESPKKSGFDTPRYLFYLVWYVGVPVGLSLGLVSLMRNVYAGSPELGFPFRFVSEQSVPAGIIFFVVFEMVLYNSRHRLPFAAHLRVAGRDDIPLQYRGDFEHAAQLLDEARRIQGKREKALERALKRNSRDELDGALETLRAVVEDEPFEAERFGEVLDKAARQIERHLGRWRKSEIREYGESILVAVGVALLLRAGVVEAFKIPSGSMLPTLQIQDHIFVNKLAYGPQLPFSKTRVLESMPPARGDVIVFEFPFPAPGETGDDFIKRVIGLPGDRIMVIDGHPTINGWKVPRCRVGRYDYGEGDSRMHHGELFVEFLGEHAYLTLFNDTGGWGKEGPFIVPQGEVYTFGDNRFNSHDSRKWNKGRGGGVPFDNIKGRSMFIWLSFASGSLTVNRMGLGVMGKPTLPAGDPEALTRRIEECLTTERPEVTEPPPPL